MINKNEWEKKEQNKGGQKAQLLCTWNIQLLLQLVTQQSSLNHIEFNGMHQGITNTHSSIVELQMNLMIEKQMNKNHVI